MTEKEIYNSLNETGWNHSTVYDIIQSEKAVQRKWHIFRILIVIAVSVTIIICQLNTIYELKNRPLVCQKVDMVKAQEDLVKMCRRRLIEEITAIPSKSGILYKSDLVKALEETEQRLNNYK